MAKIDISSDGTQENTVLFVNGEKLEGVTKVSWALDNGLVDSARLVIECLPGAVSVNSAPKER